MAWSIGARRIAGADPSTCYLSARMLPFTLNQKKLRKLRRDPKAFFSDALRNRGISAVALARKAAPMLPLPSPTSTRNRYSVVSAVYNVEAYLEEFFESMARQSLSLDHSIELIMVDDGSTDGSAEIIQKWQAKYPESIRYIHKANGGQASARNVGLGHVTGDWVTFIDPDDFVDARYFESVDRFIAENDDKELGLICCKWVVYHEKDKSFVNNHPLTYRFAKGSFATLQQDQADFMASSAATSFFRTDVLARHHHLFDETIRPNFEDGHFSGRYLLRIPDLHVGFVADARYYYRKRQDGSSTLDRGWANPSRFSTVVEKGYLGLLEEACALSGRPPRSVQRLVLYDLFWYVKRIVDNEPSVSFLDDGQKKRFFELLCRVFERIDASTVANFDLAGAWFFHKVGMLGLFKGEPPPYQIAYVQSYDPVKKLAQVAYFFHGDQPAERFCVDGRDVVPCFAKSRVHDFLGHTFVHERLAWVPLEDGYSTLTVEIDGSEAKLAVGGKHHGHAVRRAIIERSVKRPPPRSEPMEVRATKWLAKSFAVRQRYADAWVLIDRDKQADDNAEHLYRYIRQSCPEINAFFVLSRESHDWERLEREGFRLIPFGSMEHKLALLNAKHLVSSHADAFVLQFLPVKWYGDVLDYKFTFLQHGVIRDDISRWLNTKHIDLFVTSSPREHESVAGDVTPYKYGRLQTRMVGLCRHDALLARSEATEKVVLIMPTWRQYLVGGTLARSAARSESRAFYKSSYAKRWREIIHSPQLRALAEEHGYRVVFFPHANMQMYIDWFEAPSWVDVRTHATEPVLQKLYRRAAVMITDYSSVFFEMGLLRKPVIYYQFDFAEMYGGAHPSRTGYFDFRRDGFGPVAETEAELLHSLREILENDARPAPEYQRRMEATLPLRDGRNRERTVEAIRALELPDIIDHQQDDIAELEARAASDRGCWDLAVARWERLCNAAEPDVPPQWLIELARAKRASGSLPEAERLLMRMQRTSPVTPQLQVEWARLATERGAWQEALLRWRDVQEIATSTPDLDATEASIGIARVHRALGALGEARAVLSATPPSHARDVALAELSMDRGEWRDAIAMWRDLLRASPGTESPIPWLRLARAHQQLGEFDEAEDALEAYEEHGGSAPIARVFRMELDAARGMTDEVRKALKTLASSLNPDWDLEARCLLCDLCRQHGLFDEAEKVLLPHLVRSHPRMALARLELLEAGKRWRAIADTAFTWRESAPGPLRTRAELIFARAYREVGMLERAIGILEPLYSEQSQSAEVLRAYAEALSEAGLLPEAVVLWQRHLIEHPDQQPQKVRVALSLALDRLGRFEEATLVLAEAVRTTSLARLRANPNDTEAHRDLLRVMLWEGDMRRRASGEAEPPTGILGWVDPTSAE